MGQQLWISNAGLLTRRLLDPVGLYGVYNHLISMQSIIALDLKKLNCYSGSAVCPTADAVQTPTGGMNYRRRSQCYDQHQHQY